MTILLHNTSKYDDSINSVSVQLLKKKRINRYRFEMPVHDVSTAITVIRVLSVP